MHYSEFLDNLQNSGYWDEKCSSCGVTFQAPEGEEECKDCRPMAQSQESLTKQMDELLLIAAKRGLYDAIDWLKDNFYNR